MSRPTFIDCDRVALKPPDEEDVQFLREGVNHPAVRRYISSFDTPYTESRFREELWPAEHDGDGVSLLVVPTEGEFEGDPVGSVQLLPVVDRDGYANFGVWFHPGAWGRGYALDAGAHLLDYGFSELRLHRVSATVMAPNDASVALCERLGFVHEGTAREAQFADGEFVDVERFGLLEDEWDGPGAVLER
ncbi:GNAT family N-acetyltransferase [Halomarina litorea]|uniref:GNAT family N-acetyltransferase n=1 Tax=Halomarina litorea TaxID=2961595 RepID=UPI0020C24DC9|nr:GNAT family protein [Halomarina sp. BCD28]